MNIHQEIPAEVTKALADYIDSRHEEVRTIGAPVDKAVGHLSRFILEGGKRVRPLYAWTGFLAARGLSGEEDPDAVIRAISSLEFIQACALIHDDIIDASDTRRGNPTIHRSVARTHQESRWCGSADHFGESVAILVGDLALVWAEDMFLESGLSPAALTRARAPWRGMRTEVIGGQLLDISLEAAGTEDIAAANSINLYKTAAYTIERPLHLGAAIAGADDTVISALRHYGRDIGVAFQLRDDLLGVFGDPAITGKPAGDDLRQGKRTELLCTALTYADRHDPAAAAELRRHVGRTKDDAIIQRLTSIIQDTGAEDVIESRISDLKASGIDYLSSAHIPDEVFTLLKELALKATERRY
ncbi:polyprenyl synthetase family protein [Corynebacterium sp. 3HC-13]|uniref:polyprenyl synthetase family protein n=1 Tax=Corynebacterium poyangense TaxID=2684405 RepID=UPI001CCF8F30|nr:polyprenyl synthetase family protein [Corynebacterium poyangense]MBZ8178160.1 polyprenyl synthetase family protein [Corynebacterium poyangense]